MLYVISCLIQDHDLRYVAAVALVCIFGSYLSMRLFARSFKASSRSERLVWVLLTGFVSGGAIWTTHFLAMLGYLPGIAAVQQLSDPQFPLKVATVLEKTGLSPHRLELEITESGLIEEQERALIIIRQLKDLGVKIAMDDYGTGYSSLSTLMSFPFDKIKIDRSFVDRVNHDRLAAAIVRSTVILAHSLNIPVLAEGVETAEHADFLRKEGCEQMQGFFFGKPLPHSGINGLVNPVEEFADVNALPHVA